MEELLQWMEYIEDIRQEQKVRHLLKDILVIVLFATLANADDWVEIALFAENYQDYLIKYIELKNGSPSHIVSAWSKEDGFCFGQKAAEEKSNEITAISELLEKLQIKGQIVTIDAMGTQKGIAEKIRYKRADYALAVKGSQGTLYEGLREYFGEEGLRRKIRETGGYKKTQEKAHGQTETRERYQTEDIKRLSQRKDWKGIKRASRWKRKAWKKRGKADGVPVFYKQLAGRNRNNEQDGEGTLECGKHALAFGCNL